MIDPPILTFRLSRFLLRLKERILAGKEGGVKKLWHPCTVLSVGRKEKILKLNR